MSTEWVSLIVAVLTLIGTIVTVWQGNKKTLQALDKQSSENDIKLNAKLDEFKAVTETKIDALTKKVEKHNNLIERTYKLEAQVAALEREVKQ